MSRAKKEKMLAAFRFHIKCKIKNGTNNVSNNYLIPFAELTDILMLEYTIGAIAGGRVPVRRSETVQFV